MILKVWIRSLITYLIKEIQIYPNGESEQLLKSIEFNFPIYRDGQEVRRLLWEKGNTVETVCLLVLRNPVTHINIDVDVEEMVQDKRGLATYGQIKDYVLEQNGLKVSSLYIAQVKQKHGIIERDNYNKPKSEGARGPVDLCSAPTGAGAETVRQPQCPPDKERAITEALKHFGMI